MSQSPHNSDPTSAQPSVDEQQARRRRALPLWLWVVLAVVLVAILLLLAITLLSGTGGDAIEPPPPNPLSSVAPSPTPSETPTPTPTPTAQDVGQGTFDSGMYEHMSAVLYSQDLGPLAVGGNFSDPITVLVANGAAAAALTPMDAAKSMDSMFTPLDPNPWDLALPNSVLESYRGGPYGEYFPIGAIVARSFDGHVFSFIGHDRLITSMFMAASEDFLH